MEGARSSVGPYEDKKSDTHWKNVSLDVYFERSLVVPQHCAGS